MDDTIILSAKTSILVYVFANPEVCMCRKLANFT